MTAPFVTSLRARPKVIQLAPIGASAITIRVEMPEVWDTVAIAVAPTEAILVVKRAALGALFPEAQMHQDFVLKFRGWEVLDESEPLGAAGILDGSILLLTYRRRRAVR